MKGLGSRGCKAEGVGQVEERIAGKASGGWLVVVW